MQRAPPGRCPVCNEVKKGARRLLVAVQPLCQDVAWALQRRAERAHTPLLWAGWTAECAARLDTWTPGEVVVDEAGAVEVQLCASCDARARALRNIKRDVEAAAAEREGQRELRSGTNAGEAARTTAIGRRPRWGGSCE
jgi:hypothetical protein